MVTGGLSIEKFVQ